MDNNWHIVKEDDRYVVLDNSSLSKLVPSITKLNPNKSTSGHKHDGQEEVYVFYKGTGIMQIDDSKFEVKTNPLACLSNKFIFKSFSRD